MFSFGMVLGRLFKIFIAARGGMQTSMSLQEKTIELPEVDFYPWKSQTSTSEKLESTEVDEQCESEGSIMVNGAFKFQRSIYKSLEVSTDDIQSQEPLPTSQNQSDSEIYAVDSSIINPEVSE